MLRGRPVQKWSHTTSGQEGGEVTVLERVECVSPRTPASGMHLPQSIYYLVYEVSTPREGAARTPTPAGGSGGIYKIFPLDPVSAS